MSEDVTGSITDEDDIMTTSEYKCYEQNRKKQVMQRLGMTPVECWTSVNLHEPCVDSSTMKPENCSEASEVTREHKLGESVDPKEGKTLYGDILSPLQSGNCVWWQNSPSRRRTSITSDRSAGSVVMSHVRSSRRSNCTMISETAACSEKSDRHGDARSCVRSFSNPGCGSHSAVGDVSNIPSTELSEKVTCSRSPRTPKIDRSISGEVNYLGKSGGGTSPRRDSFLTPTSGERADVVVQLSRSEEAERLASKYFQKNLAETVISDMSKDANDYSNTLLYRLDDFEDIDEVEPEPRRRQSRPLRRDSVQLYKATIQEHRMTRKSGKAHSEKKTDLESLDTDIVSMCIDGQYPNDMNSASDVSNMLAINLNMVHEAEPSVLGSPGVPVVVMKKLEGACTSDVKGNLSISLQQHLNKVSTLNNESSDSTQKNEAGGDRYRYKRRASVVARANILLMEAGDTGDLLSSPAHKSDAKRRRKNESHNLEDIYLNRLWRTQMPKERNWPAILEDPVVLSTTCKEVKQTSGSRPRGRGRGADVLKKNNSVESSEDSASIYETSAAVDALVEQDVDAATNTDRILDEERNMRYFSLRSKRCSLAFDLEPTRAKQKYRHKRAIQQGWKPVSKKRDKECEQRLFQVLEKMDEEIRDSV